MDTYLRSNPQNLGAMFSLERLEKMPTLCVGQADDLKVESGFFRFWLCRCGIADGMEADNIVTAEKLVNGCWIEDYQYIAE